MCYQSSAPLSTSLYKLHSRNYQRELLSPATCLAHRCCSLTTALLQGRIALGNIEEDSNVLGHPGVKLLSCLTWDRSRVLAAGDEDSGWLLGAAWARRTKKGLGTDDPVL